MMESGHMIIVRGGGDLATGTIHRLWSAGYPVLVIEAEYPSAIRRQVSVCEAVYGQETVIEGMRAVQIHNYAQIEEIWKTGAVPVMVDPKGNTIRDLHPDIVVDAMIAKRNLGTTIDMAPLTIALGPGFEAGKDVHYVVETKRGHNLGRIISEGSAVKNSGIPGNIGGYTKERVIHSPGEGMIKNHAKIGDVVEQGDLIATIEGAGQKEEAQIRATISGILRGLIRDGYPVTEGFKIADIDPRITELDNTFTISDKARCIAGSVLELVCRYWNKK